MSHTFKKGAGVLPYCIQDINGKKEILFLFHQTFEGKKINTLVDFGGAVEQGEDELFSAAREWAEETLGLFLNNVIIIYDPVLEKQSISTCTDHTLQQLKSTANLVHLTSSYDYHIFFFKIPFQNLEIINDQFEKAPKKRKFWWINAKDILENKTPLTLFARLVVLDQEIKYVIQKILTENNVQ